MGQIFSISEFEGYINQAMRMSQIYREGVVTLSAISLISAMDQQAKSLISHASAFAIVGIFRSIRLNVATPSKISSSNADESLANDLFSQTVLIG